MTPIRAEDVRVKRIFIRASGPARLRLLARLRTQAARQDTTDTGLARDILFDALERDTGYTSGTRRKARRRPNTQPRPGKQQDRNVLAIPVSADEHARITALAADNGQTITEWAWGEIEQAMKPQRRKR